MEMKINVTGQRFSKVKAGYNLIVKGIHILKPYQIINIYNADNRANIFAEVKSSFVCAINSLNKDDAINAGFSEVPLLVAEMTKDKALNANACTVITLNRK